MTPDEYEKLERMDRVLWFYRGKRAIVRHWINAFLKLQPSDTLVDGGTGTGVWPLEMSQHCRAIGLDDHAESIALAKPRLEAAGGTILQTTLDHVDLPSDSVAVVTLMDVLEHLDDDAAALAEMIRLVKPGGLVVITVPALRWLWSDWDTVLHHRRRYHKPDLLALARRFDVDVLRCSYMNTVALAPIMAVRFWRKFFPPKLGARRAEDRLPPAPLNWLLYQTFLQPAKWRWFQPPLGVSLLMVLRKRGPLESVF